jgi:deazaflavin-dependent oxidoreductase (nitroreductase family)
MLADSTVADERIRQALARGGVIDITTIGRQSGEARRIEIVLHNIGGRLFISGMPSPRKRNWIANLEAEARFIVHLKRGVRADLPARARVISTETERRAFLPAIARVWGRHDLEAIEAMVRQSPLIEVTIDAQAA